MSNSNRRGIKEEPSLSDLVADVELAFDIPTNDSKLKFNPLIAGLCKGIREHGTLTKAAKEMQVSYSHAWNTVIAYEKENGVDIVHREKPQGCWLTPLGNKLLDGYLELEGELSGYVKDCYTETFGLSANLAVDDQLVSKLCKGI